MLRSLSKSVVGLVGKTACKQRNMQFQPVVRVVLPSVSFPVITVREFSVGRAGKSVKPGEAIVVDGDPHKVQRITQGKRGKGGGFVRYS